MIKIKKFPARGFFLLSLLAASLAFTGCGLWNNFTTYFNLYYNAERLFNESEQEIIQQKKNYFSIQDSRSIGNASGNLTKVIEKLSKLLQFNAQSAYVDDALLMIGKSFFYQQDYQKALRKFTELISTAPNSDLVPQARFWIAKTELRLKNYTQAIAILDELSAKALAVKDEEMLSQIYTEQVGYFMAIEKYNDAIVAARKLIEISGNDELNAAAMFEIGRLN
ncbi:MAG: tetratricopeptide repeat protein, partial [Syntrophothermus sp.]